MAVLPNMQVERDEELGLTIWIDTTNQSVSIGLEESWYVRSIVSLPVDLSGRELNEQICEELHMQFPTQSMDWLFDYVPLNGAPPLDGLQAWELFALASKQMVAIRKLCSAPRNACPSATWSGGVFLSNATASTKPAVAQALYQGWPRVMCKPCLVFGCGFGLFVGERLLG